MERAREIGEGSASSLREQRNLREKERRMRMKHLFSILSSHVSPTRRVRLSLSTCILLFIYTEYIIFRRCNVCVGFV